MFDYNVFEYNKKDEKMNYIFIITIKYINLYTFDFNMDIFFWIIVQNSLNRYENYILDLLVYLLISVFFS